MRHFKKQTVKMGLDICHIILEDQNEDSLDSLDVNDFRDNQQFLYKHQNKIFEINGEKIIYYKDLGYIRKQVNPNYLKEFTNDKLYFLKSDVEKLRKYLEAHEHQQELEDYFQKKFIDNFIEGESIFFISY